ncbi:rRNA maturation RNase YbeY [Elusimicrobiota bacterium]
MKRKKQKTGRAQLMIELVWLVPGKGRYSSLLRRLRKATKISLRKTKKSFHGKILVVIGDDRHMKDAKKRFFGRRVTSDVMSFSYPKAKRFIVGVPAMEILINVRQAERQVPALKARQAIESELVFLYIHGFLHERGFSDSTVRGKQKMLCLGERISAECA